VLNISKDPKASWLLQVHKYLNNNKPMLCSYCFSQRISPHQLYVVAAVSVGYIFPGIKRILID